MKAFVLNDETRKNSHGFYLLNAGGRFDRFRENPVMLHNHLEGRLTGKWLNLRIDGHLLIADPEFDEGDPEAVMLKGKVERGYLNGASPGIIILAAEWRDNPATNQSEIYVTDWELYEGSTVPIPSNAGALTLKVYDTNSHLVSDDKVRLHIEDIIKLSVSQSVNKPIQKDETMEIKLTAEALVALGIKDGADGAAISAAVVLLKQAKDQATADLKLEKEKNEAARQKQATELVELAVKEGRIPADKKENFIKLALQDFDMAKTTLDAIPAKQSLSAHVKEVVGNSDIPKDRENWTLLKWMQNDMTGLNRLKAESPAAYEQIKSKK